MPYRENYHKQGEIMSQMLTAKEIQSLLDVDRSTVYRMAEDGRLPAIKVGRQWRFPAQKIEDWLGEQQFTLASATELAHGETAVPRLQTSLHQLAYARIVINHQHILDGAKPFNFGQ